MASQIWLEPWIAPITVCVGVIGVSVVARLAMRPPGPLPAPKRKLRGLVTMGCSACQQEMNIAKDDFVPISGSEVALVVGSHPSLAGRKLAEYVCPSCGASHCFVVEKNEPAWVGANLYSPQEKSTSCLECRKRLRMPRWPEGGDSDTTFSAPDLQPDYGVVCSRCGSVCCIECVERFSRADARTSEVKCPRCGGSPVNRIFHGM